MFVMGRCVLRGEWEAAEREGRADLRVFIRQSSWLPGWLAGTSPGLWGWGGDAADGELQQMGGGGDVGGWSPARARSLGLPGGSGSCNVSKGPFEIRTASLPSVPHSPLLSPPQLFSPSRTPTTKKTLAIDAGTRQVLGLWRNQTRIMADPPRCFNVSRPSMPPLRWGPQLRAQGPRHEPAHHHLARHGCMICTRLRQHKHRQGRRIAEVSPKEEGPC